MTELPVALNRSLMLPPRNQAGDTDVHRIAGGGGFGDPLAREPELVAADVANDKVSVPAARERYGVVVDEDGVLDRATTENLRARTRREENG